MFDVIRRTEMGDRYYAEPHHRYLNRTARAPYARIRELLENWLERFPELDTREWRGRFLSEDDRHHFGGFFELYCRALLAGQGYTVVRDPPVPGRDTHPEFLVLQGNHPVFVLECTLAAGPHFGGAEQKRINRVYDAIDLLKSPDFFVGVHVNHPGSRDLRAGPLRSWLQTKLGELDPDEVKLHETAEDQAVLEWTGTFADWTITFLPIPKKAEYRNELGVRPLGLMMSGPDVLDSAKHLKKALEKKASKYGIPALPYVIAVDVMEFFVANRHALDALFGSRRLVPNFVTRTATYGRRVADGFWTERPGAHGRVSAVLIADSVFPHSIAVETPILWHNPWAQKSLDPSLWHGPQMVPDANIQGLVSDGGKTGAEILGLSPDWPGWDDDIDE